MQALLKKQTETLNRLEEKAKVDNVIQLAQLYESRRIDGDGDRIEEQLKELNKTAKAALNEKSGDGLNSNVIKLFKEMQKVGAAVTSRSLNKGEVDDITGKVGERRQFNTLKPRVEKFKEGFKDFFTMRGFLDKTGIAERGSGGIISEYLDRGEAKKNYIDQRMKTKGTTFGNEETFGKQFDEQQRIQGEINKNEAEIKRLRESGATDVGLKRSGLLDKRDQLATDIAKVDPSLRPQGFDPRTGKVKEKPESAAKQEANAKGGAEIIPFTGAESAGSGGLAAASAEETMLEQNRMVAQQTDLLTKIEENTRALKTSAPNEPKQRAPEAAGGGSSLMDMGRRGVGRLGRIASSAGRGLMAGVKTAGGFLAKRAGPLAAIGAVGAGAYAGYQGYQAAGDKEQESLKAIDAKVASGEITEQQANTLRKESKEGATVERSGAAGKGTGMAVGGAAGALKGAAVGAAIGSAVPIVGTVIGGAIGAGLGAVGGSVLGGKAGEFIGEKFGKAKNFLFGKSGESDTKVTRADTEEKSSSVNIQFSEMAFAQNDPENYAKFRKERDALAEKYANESFKKYKSRGGKRTEPDSMDYRTGKMKADTETIQKYRKEIEAAGAGKVTGGKKEDPVAPGDKTAEALKKTAEGVTPKPSGQQVTKNADGSTTTKESYTMIAGERAEGGKPLSEKQMSVIGISKSMGNSYSPEIEKQYASQKAASDSAKLKPADTPSTGNIISKQSGDNEQAKMDANKGGNNTAIVAAPTVNNNNTVQNSPVKLPPRNTDSTVNKYMQSRWAY
jgi:hypothetical protein